MLFRIKQQVQRICIKIQRTATEFGSKLNSALALSHEPVQLQKNNYKIKVNICWQRVN